MTTIRAITPINIGDLQPLSPKTPMPEPRVVDPEVCLWMAPISDPSRNEVVVRYERS